MGIERARTAIIGLLCGLLVGCGGGGGSGRGGDPPQPPPPPPPQTQRIMFNTPGPINAGAGTTVTNLASGGAGTGTISYASSDTAVAGVDVATGVASLLAVGTATITATKAASTGFESASTTYTVNVSQGTQTLVFASSNTLNTLLDATASNVASGGAGTGAITYTSSDPTVVTVDSSTGSTSAIGIGSAFVTATKAADVNFAQAQASYTINVQTASRLGAWIGKDDSHLYVPQSANGKKLGSAPASGCTVGQSIVTCTNAKQTPVNGPLIIDPNTTLASPGYYAIIDGANIGEPVLASADRFSERIGHAVVRFKDRYWLFGGAAPVLPRVTPTVQFSRYADVWSSADGRTWRLERDGAAFGRRWFHRTVVFDGAIWMIGGHAPEDRSGPGNAGLNDIYRSTDGVNWTFISQTFPLLPAPPLDPINLTATVFEDEIWVVRHGEAYSTTNGVNWTQKATGLFGGGTRANASLTVYDNALWYVGGTPSFVSSGNNVGIDASNAVYKSSDGITWSQLAAPPFTPRFRHSSFVRNGKLWVFGGQGYVNGAPAPAPGDAWSTTDGVTWTQETTTGRLARGFFLETIEESNPARVTIVGGIQGTYANAVWQSSGTAQWTVRTAFAQFSPRHTETAVFNGYFWAIGGAVTNDGTPGSGNIDEVWRSADGLNWTRITPTTPIFSPRDGHRVLVFNNRLWVIGGWDNVTGGSGTRNNEVWSTTDGASWTKHATPGFDARVGHAAVSFDGRLWVIGGSTGPGVVTNDVWSSVNGETWNRETNAGLFPARATHEVVVFGGEMWLLGGGTVAGAGMADAWSSKDGITWIQRDPPGFPARTWHSAAVANGRIYVIGGVSEEAYETAQRYNDVWWTADGKTWTKEPDAAPFAPRGLHNLVVRNNELWVIAGLSLSYRNDVWRSTDGAHWRVGSTQDIVAP